MNTQCNEVIRWIEEYPHATEEEITKKKQEAEAVCKPVSMRFYATSGSFDGQSLNGRQFPETGTDQGGPIIDEVD